LCDLTVFQLQISENSVIEALPCSWD